MNDSLTMARARPPSSQAPPVYTNPLSEDGNQAYLASGSSHLIPASAPGMYGHGNHHGQQAPPGAQSMVSSSSLESHVLELSKMVVQLVQQIKSLQTPNNKIIK